MLLHRWLIASLVVSAAGLLAQEALDRDEYAREHVRFLVVQLDQWSKEFPQQFNAALMRAPVDATKLTEAAKKGPAEFGDSMGFLTALSSAKDLLSNADFRSQLEKTIVALKETNHAMSVQRFPAVLQSDWDQIR